MMSYKPSSTIQEENVDDNHHHSQQLHLHLPHISSLSDLKIDIPTDIYNHLQNQYKSFDGATARTTTSTTTATNNGANSNHLDLVLQAMKSPPQTTTCRVNLCVASSVDEVVTELNHFLSALNHHEEHCDDNEDDYNVDSDQEEDDDDDDVEDKKVQFDSETYCSIKSKITSSNALPIIPQGVVFQANKHSILPDVIEIKLLSNFLTADGNNHDDNTDTASSHTIHTLDNYISLPIELLPKSSQSVWWPSRMKSSFPTDPYKAIICDRKCGEAVLRGSHIFVRGILAADKNIKKKDIVYVYTHLDTKQIENQQIPTIRRGVSIDNYIGHCVFLGIGQVMCTRAEMFNLTQGLGVKMLNGILGSQIINMKNTYDGTSASAAKKNVRRYYTTRAGPLCPPMNDILPDKMMLQNLPSILVGHVLDPKRKEVIIDLCCAPGGKALHVASLVNNDAIIVACDKSRKKVKTTKDYFEQMGASCITPLCLDSTKCVLLQGGGYCSNATETTGNIGREEWKNVEAIISMAKQSEDGLLEVKGFYPNSFDRIVLDPPCSALGLRPKLSIDIKRLSDLQKFADYQKKFINSAVLLLKDGGTLVYSTCTINANENEIMVKYILDNFKCMKLVQIKFDIGLQGLPNCGLNDEERSKVRRFDPSDEADTMGFFIAKFVKEYITI